MKKLIILVLVGVAAMQIYDKYSVPVITNADLKLLNEPSKKTPQFETAFESSYSCDGRQHCSQMTSREEAVYFIQNCPNTKMDGDYDGIPCENDSRF